MRSPLSLLSSRLNRPWLPLQALHHLCVTLLDVVPQFSILLTLWHPSLPTGLTVRLPQHRAEGVNPSLCPASDAVPDAPQDSVKGHAACVATQTAHGLEQVREHTVRNMIARLWIIVTGN